MLGNSEAAAMDAKMISQINAQLSVIHTQLHAVIMSKDTPKSERELVSMLQSSVYTTSEIASHLLGVALEASK